MLHKNPMQKGSFDIKNLTSSLNQIPQHLDMI